MDTATAHAAALPPQRPAPHGAGAPVSTTAAPASRLGTFLYRCFSRSGDLLYVGISYSAIVRLAGHRGKSWFADVARVDIEAFASRDEAAEAERQAIANERPLHNVHGRPKVRRDSHEDAARVAALTARIASLEGELARSGQAGPVCASARAKRIYRPSEAARYLGVSKATLYRMADDGRIPPPVRLGPQSTGWKVDDLESYIESCAGGAR